MARFDAELVARGLVSGRDRAASLIRDGRAEVNGKIVLKPSFDVSQDDVLTAHDTPYVGRGGLKLERALAAFSVDVTGMTCVDLGASTGGFTDCLLRHGAAHVYAVDVGHGQLDASLRRDPRVTVMEGVNARLVTPAMFPRPPAIVTADLSFISLRLIFPVIAALLPASGKAVTLIKPQFEAGRAALSKNGVVRDTRDHVRVLRELDEAAMTHRLFLQGVCVSPIRGQEGNVEYLGYFTKEKRMRAHNYEALVKSPD